MAKLVLNTAATALANQFYTDLESSLNDGIDADGTSLDKSGLTNYNDPSKVSDANKTAIKDTFLLSAAPLIKAVAPMLGSSPAWYSNSAPSYTTSSTSFVDIGASVSFTQVSDLQPVIVTFDMSLYSTVSSTIMEIQLSYNGIPQAVTYPWVFNNANTHVGVSFSWLVTSTGLAGSKYVSIQLRRTSGTGVLTLDSGDHMSLIVK